MRLVIGKFNLEVSAQDIAILLAVLLGLGGSATYFTRSHPNDSSRNELTDVRKEKRTKNYSDSLKQDGKKSLR